MSLHLANDRYEPLPYWVCVAAEAGAIFAVGVAAFQLAIRFAAWVGPGLYR